MKRLIIVIASAALLAGVPASAGEYSGNGNYVPGGDTGRSACSYSGLNDDDDGQGFTQTFAAFFKMMGIPVGFWFNAGQFCRGN